MLTLSPEMSPGSANTICKSCSLSLTLVTFQLSIVLLPRLSGFFLTVISSIVSFITDVFATLCEYLRVKNPLLVMSLTSTLSDLFYFGAVAMKIFVLFTLFLFADGVLMIIGTASGS